jgi:hypothetical protein
MARAHFYKPVQDAEGNLVTSVSVRVLDPGTDTEIAETLYQTDVDLGTYDNPFISVDGIIDFYLAAPKRVDVEVTAGSIVTLFSNVDVGAQPSLSIILTDANDVDWELTVGIDGALTTTVVP